MCNITQTRFLVRLFFYFSDSQFLYWMVCIFYLWWHDSKNRGLCHYYKASAMTKSLVKRGGYELNSMNSPIKSARTDKAPIQRPPKAAAVGMYLLRQKTKIIIFLWVTFLAETSKDLEIILITTVLSSTNSLSHTSLYFSLKTSFVYSNLFSLAKTVTIRCYCNSFSQTEEVWINKTCLKAKIKASTWKTIRRTQYSFYENYYFSFKLKFNSSNQ